jgi:predicted anti-sigma-YlaC factor YlaD
MTMVNGCPREKEVRELVERGQWPAAIAPELNAHLRECRACADLALVTDVFQQARANAAGPRNVAAPGLLWWKAQLRRREEAMERIGRPILSAQIFALVLNLMVVIGLVAWEAAHGVDWLSWFVTTGQAGEAGIGSLLAGALSGWGLLVVIPAMAIVALLCGAAVYLAAAEH